MCARVERERISGKDYFEFYFNAMTMFLVRNAGDQVIRVQYADVVPVIETECLSHYLLKFTYPNC